MIAVTINHAQRAPNLFEYITGGGGRWTSGAELFLLLSGLTYAIVRKRTLQKEGWNSLWKKSISRALIIYAVSLVTSVIVLAIANHYDCSVGWRNQGASTCDPLTLTTLWRVLTLQQTYYWVAMLSYYTLYIALAPLMLWLLSKKLWWILLIISIVSYLFRSPEKASTFQVFFVLGIIVGYYWNNPKKRLQKPLQRYSLTLAGMAAFLSFAGSTIITDSAFSRALPWVVTGFQSLQLGELSRGPMMPARVLFSFLWFLGLLYFFKQFESALSTRLGWLLLPIGKNTLYLFAIHAVVIFALNLYLNNETSASRIVNSVIISLPVALLWIGGKYLEARKSNRKNIVKQLPYQSLNAHST